MKNVKGRGAPPLIICENTAAHKNISCILKVFDADCSPSHVDFDVKSERESLGVADLPRDESRALDAD